MNDDPAAKAVVDPGGITAAIDRYRTLAKWIIGVFAGVGALLVAGSQLSSLGKLSLEDDLLRIVAAVVSLALALAAAVYVVRQALAVLRPVRTSFDDVLADSALTKRLEAQKEQLPFGATTVEEVREIYSEALADPNLTHEEKEAWQAGATQLLRQASYLKVEGRFDGAWTKMAWGAAVAAAAILVFAYAANPAEPDAAGTAAVPPQPTAVSVTLTSAGSESLKGALGEECVAQDEFPAIAIGGTEQTPTLVSVPDEPLWRGPVQSAGGLGQRPVDAQPPRPHRPAGRGRGNH